MYLCNLFIVHLFYLWFVFIWAERRKKKNIFSVRIRSNNCVNTIRVLPFNKTYVWEWQGGCWVHPNGLVCMATISAQSPGPISQRTPLFLISLSFSWGVKDHRVPSENAAFFSFFFFFAPLVYFRFILRRTYKYICEQDKSFVVRVYLYVLAHLRNRKTCQMRIPIAQVFANKNINYFV